MSTGHLMAIIIITTFTGGANFFSWSDPGRHQGPEGGGLIVMVFVLMLMFAEMFHIASPFCTYLSQSSTLKIKIDFA